MEVMSHNDWDGVAERVPNTPHDLFVRLRVSFGNHRAVQREQQAIELRSAFQTRDQPSGKRIECFLRQWTLRRRCRDVSGIDVKALAIGALQVPRYFRAAFSQRSD